MAKTASMLIDVIFIAACW